MASSSEISILDRARVSLGTRLLGGRKAVEQLRFAPLWAKHAWSDIAFRALAKEGYKANAAVYACVQAWAQAFPEPEMHVRSRAKDGATEWLYEHPARALVSRPNPFMGEDEFWSFVITYMALGGNCYIWKERANSRVPIALWPMHDGQVRPIPGETPADGWISHYVYDDGSGESGVRLETSDVIHLRWAVDPLQPTRGLSPLIAAARSVDTANEAMRYQFALLKNDAVVSTLVSLKEPIGKARIQALKQQFRDSFGGDNRGEVAFTEGSEMTISRLGANLQELAIEALLNVPEANIAAAFEVPPGLAGLNVALQRPAGLGSVGDTAVQEFTTRRLVPKWRRVGSQFTAQLLPDFGNARGLAYEFDTVVVQALREDEVALITAVGGAVSGGWMRISEARARLKLPVESTDDVYLRSFSMIEVPAVGSRPEPPALPPPTDAGLASDTPPADTTAKSLAPPETKAKPKRATAADAKRAKAIIDDALARRERLTKTAAGEVGKALGGIRDVAASKARAGKPVKLTDRELEPMAKAIKGHATRTIEDAYAHVGEVVGAKVPYSQTTPGVQRALDRVGERIDGMNETTRDALQGYVNLGVDEGWSLSELATHIEADASGAFNEARAMMVARTETAIVYTQGSVSGYRDSGRVDKVIVFDGDECGWTDHDDPDLADGSIRTLDEADEYPLAHPNCVRAVAPYFDMGDGEGE